MADLTGVGMRLGLAHVHLMGQLGARVTLAQLAERVSREHGERSFAAPQMSDYQKAKAMPPLDVIAAYAKACGVDPGWIAFGASTAAPAPNVRAAELSLPTTQPAKKPRRNRA